MGFAHWLEDSFPANRRCGGCDGAFTPHSKPCARFTYSDDMEIGAKYLRPFHLSFRSDFGLPGMADPFDMVTLMELICTQGSLSSDLVCGSDSELCFASHSESQSMTRYCCCSHFPSGFAQTPTKVAWRSSQSPGLARPIWRVPTRSCLDWWKVRSLPSLSVEQNLPINHSKIFNPCVMPFCSIPFSVQQCCNLFQWRLCVTPFVMPFCSSPFSVQECCHPFQWGL